MKEFKSKEIIFNELSNKVLNKKQQELKALLEEFSSTHFLCGWTAIALYLWHRESIDFDFVNDKTQWTFINYLQRIKKNNFDLLREEVENYNWIQYENQDEFHFTINQVNFSTFNFFRTLYDDQKILIRWEDYILWWLRIASKQELLSMKIYATMTRNKWKDIVDLYFLLDDLNLSLKEAFELSETYFINLINKPSILEQLISKNWDKTEKVNYLLVNPPKDQEIEIFFKEEAIKLI